MQLRESVAMPFSGVPGSPSGDVPWRERGCVLNELKLLFRHYAIAIPVLLLILAIVFTATFIGLVMKQFQSLGNEVVLASAGVSLQVDVIARFPLQSHRSSGDEPRPFIHFLACKLSASLWDRRRPKRGGLRG